jgi:hypothetical protein
MAAGSRWVWHDFEDTCSGPAAWDLAASTATRRLDSFRVLAAYGDPVDARQLHACQQLRLLHLTVWYALYAERLPECRQRAAEFLAPGGRHYRHLDMRPATCQFSLTGRSVPYRAQRFRSGFAARNRLSSRLGSAK